MDRGIGYEPVARPVWDKSKKAWKHMPLADWVEGQNIAAVTRPWLTEAEFDAQAVEGVAPKPRGRKKADPQPVEPEPAPSSSSGIPKKEISSEPTG